MAKKKTVISRSHFRKFVTMDQLAKQLKVCRSAVDNAMRRFLAAYPDTKIETKMIRTGKRGPATHALRVVS